MSFINAGEGIIYIFKGVMALKYFEVSATTIMKCK